MSLLQQRVFVTGGTGMVGSYLLRYLVGIGHTQIHALKREASSLDLVADVAHKITWHVGDIGDPVLLETLFEGIDTVFHVAGKVSHEDREANALMEANAVGTLNIVEACLFMQVKRLIYFSSVAAIGRFTNRLDYDEQFIWQQSPLNSWYAVSKMRAEQEVWRGVAEGLDAIVLNPSQVLGGCYWNHGTGRLLQHVWNGRPFFPKGSTGWVDARDLARFAIEVSILPLVPQRIVVSAENIRYYYILKEIAEGLQATAPSWGATRIVSGISWRLQALRAILTGIRPDVTRISAKNSALHFKYINTRSLQILPDFRYTPIKRTLAELTALFIFSKSENKESAILPLTGVELLRRKMNLPQKTAE